MKNEEVLKKIKRERKGRKSDKNKFWHILPFDLCLHHNSFSLIFDFFFPLNYVIKLKYRLYMKQTFYPLFKIIIKTYIY